MSTVPIHAINRLKQSTQFARLLPIIGLSISSHGVEFLKHARDRIVICFHDIKSIHCACQDQDLRYFAYVTREQRGITGMPTVPIQLPSAFAKADYQHYCHVFVVKHQSMSTEVSFVRIDLAIGLICCRFCWILVKPLTSLFTRSIVSIPNRCISIHRIGKSVRNTSRCPRRPWMNEEFSSDLGIVYRASFLGLFLFTRRIYK